MPARRKSTPPPADFYIVNPGGAVHSVTPDDLTHLLQRPGYRAATPGEVAAYRAAVVQVATDPIGKRGL